MEFLAVFAAALASYVLGSIWYMTLAKPWMAASGVPTTEDGKPANANNPMLYIGAFVCALIVSGMMRHVFALSGFDNIGEGLIAGLGIGLFLATPWIITNYSFAGRPRALMLIDGGYATLGCTAMGAVHMLF
ncbi:DUF1761 domain-containing protein [Shimia sp. R11_0]|uniref:DUF1761 domain-containing protein n=1 Tax=Shimia sp. R11_0 TaxID=2821096 RepID=UPI001ADCEBE1|nr:DUF1761 domain-containing protein [Shimia sp. R11_0]MBO9476189.1 DUF1761 domain-containing protein [Shimia sp. R11_0]